MFDEKIHIFLDTSEYRALQYDFKGINVSSLKQLFLICISKNVELYINEIIREEIKEDLIELASKHKQVLKSALEGPKGVDLFIQMDKREIREKIKNLKIGEEYVSEFTEYLSDIKVKYIDIELANSRKIFEKYFAKIPPFSEDKKEEFPDAYTIDSILEYVKKEELSGTFLVVSRDSDWKKSFAKEKSIHFFEHLNKALNFISQKDNKEYNLEVIKELTYTEGFIEKLKLKIEEQGAILLFDFNGNVDIYNIDIKDTDDYNMIGSDNDSIIYSGYAATILSCNVSLFDESMSVWDKEKETYLTTGYRHIAIDRNESIYFEIVVNLNDISDGKVDIEYKIQNVNHNEELVFDDRRIRELYLP